jgi:hypothetical protein
MTLSALISVVIVLVVLGLALYLIETYIPLSPPFKVVIRVVIILAVVLWLLSAAGLWSGPVFRR